MGGNTAQRKQRVTADEEVWVKGRLKTLIKMGIVLRDCELVRADGLLYEYGINGIIEGAAIEIIRLLGLEPSFINLRGTRLELTGEMEETI